MNPYDNDPREPIKEWEGIVEDVECGGCERTILSAHAVYNGYANGNYDACWICLTCDTENTTVFEAVESYKDVLCVVCKDAYIDEWVESEWICDECESITTGVPIDQL
jgi:hypothetical protein